MSNRRNLLYPLLVIVLRALTALFALSTAAAAPAQMPDSSIVVDQNSVAGFANALTHRMGLSGHVLWLDATANIDTLSTPEGIETTVRKAKRAHINTLVMDVKPLSGEVVYASKIAPRLSQWKGKEYNPGFDRLAAVIAAARRHGLRVAASVNVFSEGHKHFRTGPAYANRAWQSVSYNVERAVVAANGQALPFPTTRNEAASAGQLSVLTTPEAARTAFKPDGLSVVVDASGRVVALGEAPFVAASVVLPAGGKVLTGTGAAREWLQANLQLGEGVRFAATPVRIPIEEAPWEKVAVFVSPHVPAVRAYELSILREIAAGYELDGIVLDRMRYANLTTDFSDAARAAFESFLGRPVTNWPEDILVYPADPALPRVEGPLYRPWLEFRAATIRDFVNEAAAAVRAARPGIEVAAYVGSWYSEYYGVGVNWAADDFAAGYDWMTPDFHRTGYAGFLDWITTGCYYPRATREEARQAGANPQATVESAAALSNRVVNDAAFVYGGLYLVNYAGKPHDFARAVRVCKAVTQGVMIFDLFYLDTYGWWGVLEDALGADAVAPHAVPGLVEVVRAGAAEIKAGQPPPPPGTAGTIPASLTP